MTTPPAEQSIATARALIRSHRANLCRHGVSICHVCDRELDAPTTPPATHPAVTTSAAVVAADPEETK